MKRKIFAGLIVVTILLFVAGCKSGTGESSDKRSLSDFTQAYVDAGYTLEREGQPLYDVIGAVDGTLFYIDNSVVKIYEYASAKDLEAAREETDLIADWPSNGKFLLETSSEDAIAIFNNVSAEPAKQVAAVKKEETKQIAIGDVISNDKCEITVNNIDFTYDVLPDDTSSFYTHYAAETGKVYVDIDTDVKNIQKQNLDCDDIMSIELDYNNGYTYTAQPVPEDSSMGFTYANITSITPLSTLGVHFLVECPQEVAESQNPVNITFDLDGTKYEYSMR